MNLPDNLSTAATRICNLLSASQTPKTSTQLTEEFAQQPAGEERHKAIATADSLIIKGIVSADKGEGDTTYSLIKSASEVGPNDEADANEEYVEKTDANAEEKRMIAILEKNDKKLPEAKLFDLYEQEQLPASSANTSVDKNEIESALKELTDAGIVSKNGEEYSIQQ